VKETDLKRKARDNSINEPVLFENRKEPPAPMRFFSCPTCFSFLKIPAAGEKSAEQAVSVKVQSAD
jgi:hypothetical protein